MIEWNCDSFRFVWRYT